MIKMRSCLVWCLIFVHLCFSNIVFVSSGSKLKALENLFRTEIFLLRGEITSVAAQQETVMKTLNETIEKLNDILVLSTKEQKINIKTKPSETDIITNNNNALVIKQLFEEIVRTQRGFLEEKAARKQDKEEIINLLKKEIASVISRTDALTSRIDFTANETEKTLEKLADEIENFANRTAVQEEQELHSAANNSQAILQHQAVTEQILEQVKAEIMEGPYFQNSTLQLIAETFRSFINPYCDDRRKYAENQQSEACLRSFFLDLIDVMPPKARLVGGMRFDKGRVEVLYKGSYRTVCDDSWDDQDATVICRMLGYSGGAAYNNHPFGYGSGVVLLGDVRCVGNEVSLFDCPHSGIRGHNCTYGRGAGVSCF